MDLAFTVGVTAGALAVALGGYVAWVLWANRRLGVRGMVRQSRLTCPKCGGAFDYAFVPGASATSLRLGRSRYMACPLCHRWSVIRLGGAPSPSPPEGGDRVGPPLG
jgi:formate dehydrogenase maturation protein FdhE